nr:chloride channel protein [Sphingomonas sp. CV7422]
MLMLAGLALVVGSGGAAAAWLLLKLIALATNLAWYDHASFAPVSIVPAAHGVRTLLVPVAGSMVIGLMARFGSEKICGHGIPEAIEAILFGQSRLSPKVAVLKPVSAAVSIGSGGPFGAEGPIIMTGGAIGSLLAQCFHLSAAERKTLLVAGAAAGMTAIFGTPVAAMLLAIEVLLFEWKPRSFVPVTVAALAAIAWRPLMIGSGPMFPLVAPMMIDATTLVGAAALGVVVGVLASSLSSALYRIEDGFHRLPVHWMWWPALGALVVGIGGLIDPRVLGAGYDNIQALLDGSMVARAIVLLLVVKAIVWVVALGSGTSGGILAPLLMLGAAVGALAGHWLPGGVGLYAMAGMAAMMSASMRAPLTAAVFAVELTGRLDALPVAAAASVAGYAIAVLVLRRSIQTVRKHDYDAGDMGGLKTPSGISGFARRSPRHRHGNCACQLGDQHPENDFSYRWGSGRRGSSNEKLVSQQQTDHDGAADVDPESGFICRTELHCSPLGRRFDTARTKEQSA